MICTVWPAASVGADGENAMETTVAGPTVRVIGVLAEPTVTVIVADPEALAVINPLVLTVATEELDVVHVAVLVTFCVDPSVYVAVAEICCV